MPATVASPRTMTTDIERIGFVQVKLSHVFEKPLG
jgi:hypothetical protein